MIIHYKQITEFKVVFTCFTPLHIPHIVILHFKDTMEAMNTCKMKCNPNNTYVKYSLENYYNYFG